MKAKIWPKKARMGVEYVRHGKETGGCKSVRLRS